jgi:hypothetical protein
VARGEVFYAVAVLDHLENGLKNADDRAISAVLAFVEPAQAVEMTEELVGTVDEVNDHFVVEVDFLALPTQKGVEPHPYPPAA